MGQCYSARACRSSWLLASSWSSYVHLRKQLYAARVYLGHTCCELRRQVPAAQVDIKQCCLNAAMAGECSNLMDVPACASEVCQTEMAQGVSAEPFDMSTPRESEHHLRPTPDGDRLGVVTAGLREKERSALLP